MQMKIVPFHTTAMDLRIVSKPHDVLCIGDGTKIMASKAEGYYFNQKAKISLCQRT